LHLSLKGKPQNLAIKDPDVQPVHLFKIKKAKLVHYTPQKDTEKSDKISSAKY